MHSASRPRQLRRARALRPRDAPRCPRRPLPAAPAVTPGGPDPRQRSAGPGPPVGVGATEEELTPCPDGVIHDARVEAVRWAARDDLRCSVRDRLPLVGRGGWAACRPAKSGANRPAPWPSGSRPTVSSCSSRLTVPLPPSALVPSGRTPASPRPTVSMWPLQLITRWCALMSATKRCWRRLARLRLRERAGASRPRRSPQPPPRQEPRRRTVTGLAGLACLSPDSPQRSAADFRSTLPAEPADSVASAGTAKAATGQPPSFTVPPWTSCPSGSRRPGQSGRRPLLRVPQGPRTAPGRRHRASDSSTCA